MPEKRSDNLLPCDDPYKVLAYRVVVAYPPETVRRLLKEPKFLRREVAREVRNQDFKGIFLDCLMVSIIADGARTEMNRQLMALGKYFYEKLDLKRMRTEVRAAYASLGIENEL